VLIDREAALKKAEKLLRQGKLKGAIEEYVRLIEDQPRDVGAINALGDLYIRAGDADRAVAQFTRVGDQLFADGFLPRAQAIYKKALKVQPHHEHTLSRLAEIADRQGMSADAVVYLRQLAERRRLRGDELGVSECVERMRALDKSGAEVSTSGTSSIAVYGTNEGTEDPAVLLAAAAKELTAGNELQGRAVLMRALALDTARHDDVVRMALDLLAQGRIETAFGCVDVAADAALLGGNLNQAIEALQTFVRVAPHIPALVKLVELCVDARLDGPLRAAQTQLADAYLDTGRGAEARVIAEDLLEQDPECETHAQRVRRAMELLGAPDAERTVADVRGRHREIDTTEASELRSPDVFGNLELEEVELSDALSQIGGMDERLADDPYNRALKHLDQGRIEEGMADLREAARTSPRRVKAAADLGRLHIRRGELHAAVEWLERAADGPVESQEEGFAVLYELADTLEQLGEHARALAILIDLDADTGGYRDVRMRIDQLMRAHPGSQPQ
jgi:tetratricopeptide (TPR) repeat protein